MKKRPLPYGYARINGEIVIVEQEATYVLWMFTEYLNGTSIPSIVNSMNLQNIPFYQDYGWNKNIVCRLLDDSRYCGNAGYPRMIPDALFQSVKNQRISRNRIQIPSGVNAVRKKLFCSCCGQKLLRKKYANKQEITWNCRSCGFSIALTDAFLIESIAVKSDEIAKGLHTANQPALSKTISVKEKLLFSELNRKLYDPHVDVTRLMELATKYIEEKYTTIPLPDSTPSDSIEIAQPKVMAEDSAGITAFVSQVSKIYIQPDYQIRILFHNGNYL